LTDLPWGLGEFVSYDEPLPSEQVNLIQWLVNEIDLILDSPGKEHWTNRWLDVLQKNTRKCFKPKIPEYSNMAMAIQSHMQ